MEKAAYHPGVTSLDVSISYECMWVSGALTYSVPGSGHCYQRMLAFLAVVMTEHSGCKLA